MFRILLIKKEKQMNYYQFKTEQLRNYQRRISPFRLVVLSNFEADGDCRTKLTLSEYERCL